MTVDVNFAAWLSEGGVLVPGSLRQGHNTLTRYGAQWLSELVSWQSLGGAGDVAFRDDKLRWIMVGDGVSLDHVGVARLAGPLTVTTGPDVYLTELPTPVRQPSSSLRYVVSWSGAGAAFDHHGASVTIREAGLFADVNGGSLSVASSDHPPVFYHRLRVPLTKLAAQTLTITWEPRN